MQGYDAVAAVFVTSDDGVLRSSRWRQGISLPVPGERLARHGRGVAVGLVVDRQVQGHGGVAPVLVAADDGVLRGSCWRFGICLPVPGERLACHRRGVAVGLVVDRQVQGHDGVAPVLVATDDGVLRGSCWRLGICLPVPGERFARHGRGVTIGFVVDGQVQGYDGVAAVMVATDNGVLRSSRWRLGISLLVPGERFARHGRSVAVGLVVDRQVQCYDAITTVFVPADNSVLWGSCRRFGVCLAVPGERFARHGRGVTIGFVVDGQVQGYDGVAAVMVATDNGVLRSSRWRLGISLLVPGERFARHRRGVAVGLVVDS